MKWWNHYYDSYWRTLFQMFKGVKMLIQYNISNNQSKKNYYICMCANMCIFACVRNRITCFGLSFKLVLPFVTTYFLFTSFVVQRVWKSSSKSIQEQKSCWLPLQILDYLLSGRWIQRLTFGFSWWTLWSLFCRKRHS